MLKQFLENKKNFKSPLKDKILIFHLFQVLTYEVKEPTIPPLILIVYWKLEAHNTDLRIDYRLNVNSNIDCSLVNVVFTTKVEGSVVSVIADPNAEW